MSKFVIAKFLLAGICVALAVYASYQFIDLRMQNHLTVVGKADAIVILGAAVWPGGGPSLILADRVKRAADLYHQGVAPKIICTGGIGTYPPAEADVERRLLLEMGVPDSAIILETATTSTAEQARAIKAICDQQGFKSIALVTSFYHEKRATQLFRRAGITEIEDARCTHDRFEDLNAKVARDAVALTVLNWWQWLLTGSMAGIVGLIWRARRRAASRTVQL
jgi:uncharacterized SAM-binding protein YcdF (DUF218 family)